MESHWFSKFSAVWCWLASQICCTMTEWLILWPRVDWCIGHTEVQQVMGIKKIESSDDSHHASCMHSFSSFNLVPTYVLTAVYLHYCHKWCSWCYCPIRALWNDSESQAIPILFRNNDRFQYQDVGEGSWDLGWTCMRISLEPMKLQST